MNLAHRTLESIGTRAKDKDTIHVAISSEAPVERWFGIEVLRHSVDAIDLTRLGDGRHPLLLNHDTNKQIGVVDRAWLDEDKKLRGEVRFSSSELGREIEQDVHDGIRSLISVGYMIDEVEEQKTDEKGLNVSRTLTGEEFQREMRELHGENFYREGQAACRAKGSQPPVYVVTRWQPFEVSVVPVPADVDVGVGRAADPAAPPQVAPTKPAAPITPPEKEIRIMSTPENKPAPTGEELERARVKAICDLGDQYRKFFTPEEQSNACRNGHSVEQVREKIMANMQSQSSDVRNTHIGMEQKEVQRYSIARAIVASLSGDWSQAGLERACSEAVAKKFGRSPEGFFVPYDAFHRDFNLGTGSEAGNLRPTDLRTDLYVDVLRNNLVMASLGLRILPGLSGNVDMPRKATASALGMLAEIGSASETNPTTAKVTLSPKRVGAYIEVSKQALIQSALALEPMLRDDLLQGAGVLLESQIINGVGSSNEMTGIRNTSGIGTVAGGANGAALIWDHLVDLESACANVNAEPDRLSGYVTNTRVRGKAKKVTKSTYLPFIWQEGATPFNGYRVAVTNNVPSNLTKGTSTTVCSALLFASDWSMGVLGLFGAPDITVDPYTKADTGQVKITLNQFADFGIRQPSAFAKQEDVLTT